jgi:ELP3 family radical SAM enzyme/protein acetyltransferase
MVPKAVEKAMVPKAVESSIKKAVRSWSGVLVVTVVMRPDAFSCTHNCAYCPDERKKNGGKYDMPRSYLSSEPAVMRAMECDFDTVRQVHARLDQLTSLGHTIDKLEIIVLGGTFSEYPREYRESFMRDLFYAANVYNSGCAYDGTRCDLQREQAMNVSAKYKIIGISIETRPDSICKQELRRLRMYGVTRVQLGIQHTDEWLLESLNRGHTVEDGVRAIRLLKSNGFKVDVHVMPDLPGATPEGDKIMLEKVITHEDYIPDYMKIYPCLDVEYTQIREWKRKKLWTPYAETNYDALVDVVIHAKRMCPEYIRFNRIQRDFPEENDTRIGYASKNIKSNFRQLVQDACARVGVSCRCIRCREIKKDSYTSFWFRVEKYRASRGTEYFISAVSDANRLLGFLRLRMNDDEQDVYFPELSSCGIIRELHVYGFISSVDGTRTGQAQHVGIGKILVCIAKMISWWHGRRSMTVISGVGVRGYYKRLGFQLKKPYGYMVLPIHSVFSILYGLWMLTTYALTRVFIK